MSVFHGGLPTCIVVRRFFLPTADRLSLRFFRMIDLGGQDDNQTCHSERSEESGLNGAICHKRSFSRASFRMTIWEKMATQTCHSEEPATKNRVRFVRWSIKILPAYGGQAFSSFLQNDR